MRARVVAVGDGALGFWAALRDVFPESCEQRRWIHNVANVLNARPSRCSRPRKMLAEIRDAEDRAEQAVRAFADEFAAKWPKAVGKITDDIEPLLTFFDFPGRALDPPQDHQPDPPSPLSVLGPGSPEAPDRVQSGLAMAFKLVESAQGRWRSVNGPKLVALVRADARFERGVLVESVEAAA